MLYYIYVEWQKETSNEEMILAEMYTIKETVIKPWKSPEALGGIWTRNFCIASAMLLLTELPKPYILETQ